MERNSRWQFWCGWSLVTLVALWAPEVNAATATINPLNIEDNTLAEEFPGQQLRGVRLDLRRYDGQQLRPPGTACGSTSAPRSRPVRRSTASR